MVKYLDKNSGFNMWNASRNAAATEKKSPFSGLLWWVLIFVASWWLIGTWMTPKTQPVATEEATVVEDLSAVPETHFTSDKIDAVVRGLRINNVQLRDFKASADGDAPVALLPDDGDFVEFGLVAAGTAAPTATTVWKSNDGVYTWRNGDGVEFRRTVSGDGYVLTVTDEINNKSARPATFAPYARIVRGTDNKSSAGVYTGAVAYANNDFDHRDWRKLDKKSYAYTTTNGYVGFADQYWETVASIDSPDQTLRVKKAGDKYQSDAAAGAVSVAPGETKTITAHIYAGPRDGGILSSATKIPHLAKTVDYGWFGFLARPMLWLLNMLNAIVMNYGIAIIIMTLLLRLAMWPLTRKSYTSMIAMQKMQPEMQRIQKLYANDKMRMQMEMMRLYQTHKTSPMSGCLPMLIQIPIFFALYKALLISVPMRGAHFLWIRDLAVMDPYFILPVLMGLTMFWQQRLQTASTPTAGSDAMAQTQKFMKWMPVLFTVMFAWMPAGLVLYWTVSNLFGIGQMYIIKMKDKK